MAPSSSATIIIQQCTTNENIECSGAIFVDSIAPSGSPIVVSSADQNLIGTSDTRDVVSVVIQVVLGDGSSNLGGNVEICIEAVGTPEELCLGFLDESLSPPEWKCEDPCLEENSEGLFCGQTNHFTNFALLLSGGSGGNAGCNSSGSFDWITGSSWGDFILVICSVAFVVCCGCIFVLVVMTVEPVRNIIYGKEGARILKTRNACHTAQHEIRL